MKKFGTNLFLQDNYLCIFLKIKMPSIKDFEKEIEKISYKFVPSECEQTQCIEIEGENNFNSFLLKLTESGQDFVTRKSYSNRKHLNLLGFKLFVIERSKAYY